MVPSPVLALLLLFPTTDASGTASKAGEHSPGWHLQSILCELHASPGGCSVDPRAFPHDCGPDVITLQKLLRICLSPGCHCAEAERLKKEGYAPPKAAYFMKQTIGNACGTIGVLHSLANNQDAISVSKHTIDCTGLHTCSITKGSKTVWQDCYPCTYHTMSHSIIYPVADCRLAWPRPAVAMCMAVSAHGACCRRGLLPAAVPGSDR